MSKLTWRYQQFTPRGKWTSEYTFDGEYRHACQGVIAGFLQEQPRAAIEEGTGRVIYALDEKGRPTAAAVALFDTIVKPPPLSPSVVDVQYETAYGKTTRFSRPIRCY